MALHIFLADCMVCRRIVAVERDRLNIDDLDEDGRRDTYFHYPLPPARYRDKIAPDLCDRCWVEHRTDILTSVSARNAHRKRGFVWAPRFNQIYLWAWVARKLEEEAVSLGKEVQRLVPHLAEKADRGRGVERRGPLRIYGPRRKVYRRGFAVA